jgi:hypothetical protein
MKKSKLFLSAAIAGLLATSANASSSRKKAPPTNEKDCLEQKMTWKDGSCTCASNGCSAKSEKAPEKKSENSCGANGCNAPEKK